MQQGEISAFLKSHCHGLSALDTDFKEVYRGILSEAAPVMNEESRMEQRKILNCHIVVSEPQATPEGTVELAKPFRSVHMEAMALDFGVLIHQLLSLPMISQQPKVPKAGRRATSATKGEIRTAHYSTYYIQLCFFWAEEKCSFHHFPQKNNWHF